MQARPSIHHRHLWSVENLANADIVHLLDTARRFRSSERVGRAGAPLRGRNVALLDEAAPEDGADSLRCAAVALGAQVSHLRPSDARISADEVDTATARLLGRLYDAVDCKALPPEVVAQVAREAGIPVFNGLGSARHPTRVLAELLVMQDHTGKALEHLRVCFAGDSTSACAEALRRVAGATGIDLSVVPWRAGCSGSDDGRDVTVDGRGDPPWPLSHPDGRPIAAERGDYRRATLQALLVYAIS